ncbi:MAG: hypothetical protein ACR2FY_19975 [Pirellulaceae bacterium]
MSTNAKNGGKTPKNTCQAEVRPQFAKTPCRRDQRAYKLRVAGLTQERIAQKLGCSQPTVHRGIGRMEKWVATTLPEDRGEFVATEKLRLALHRHETLLEHLQRRALRDYRRSKRPVPVEKVVTRKVTRTKGDEQTVTDETRTEKCNKPQRCQVALLSYAGKVSHELAVMASGYLGPGNGSISMAEFMDPEERDRWNRIVDRRDAIIVELQRKVAELSSGSGVFGTSDSPSSSTPQPKTPDPLAPQSQTRAEQREDGLRAEKQTGADQDVQPRGTGVFGGCVLPLAEPLAPKTPDPGCSHELKPGENDPVVNKVPSLDAVATPTRPALCDQPLDTGAAPSRELENLNKTPPQPEVDSPMLGAAHPTPPVNAKPNDGLPLCNMGHLDSSVLAGMEIPEEKRPRWDDAARQEALDYHCMIHGIPPLELHQVTGIPDPKTISPKMWMQRGYPYMIYSDRSIPSKREPVRDKRKVITVY